MITWINKHASFLLFLWISGLSLLYATLSIVRHTRYQSGGFDLGIYDQAVWQYSKFLWPYNTIKERFILGDHLTLTLPLLSPLFWIWDDVRMLLVFQAFFLTTSAFAAYKLARLRGLTPFVSLTLSIIYSLFYGIQYAIFFDFHPVTLGVALIMWLAYFLESNRRKLFFTTLLLVILTQENMGLAIASLGFFYLFLVWYRKVGAAFLIGGIITSLIAISLVSWFSPVGYEYTPDLPANPVAFISRLFDADEKRQVWGYTFAAFSFVPLLSPAAILAATSDLGQYFVTGEVFNQMWSPFKHHRAILGVFMFLGARDVFVRWKKRESTLVIASLVLVASALLQYVFHFPLNKLAKASFWQYERWMADVTSILSVVPKDAGVAAQQSLVPHLSHRTEIYLFWPRTHGAEVPCDSYPCWWLDFGGNPEYLVIDLHPNQWLTQLLETNEHVEEALTNMEKAGVIRLQQSVNDAKLFRIIPAGDSRKGLM